MEENKNKPKDGEICETKAYRNTSKCETPKQLFNIISYFESFSKHCLCDLILYEIIKLRSKKNVVKEDKMHKLYANIQSARGARV